MDKRGSGLKRICNETKKLESYKADRMPVFKSTSSQFMTIIYSMEYEKQNTMDSLRAETKLGLSWEQVGTKLGLSWDEVEKLFVTLQRPTSISDLNFARLVKLFKVQGKICNPFNRSTTCLHDSSRQTN